MSRLSLLSFFLLALFSCKQTPKENVQETLSDASQTNSTIATKIFSEGVINVDIDFPGNKLSSLLKKTDPTKGNMEQQLKTLTETLPIEEQENIKKLTEGNPFIALQVMMAPIFSNTVYVKGNVATAKCDGLNYHLENTINAESEAGTIHLASRSNPSNTVTFTYDKTFFGESQLQTKIDMEQYDRQETDQTGNIAGYPCKKMVYTLKQVGSNPMSITRLDVWTSDLMPKSLNFVHPYYLEESGGIMKIDLYNNPDENPVMVYEFKKVTSTTVSETELEVVKGNPIYDSNSDLMEIAGKLLGILFGG